MRAGALALVVSLIAAGCVAPGADLAPASVLGGALGSITIDGAVSTTLPNGDLLLTIAGETAGIEEYEFEVPEGVTFVEAEISTSDEAPFAVSMRNADTLASVCWPQRMRGWGQAVDGEMRCTAIGGMDVGAKWQVRAINLLGASGLVDVGVPLPAPIGDDTTPKPFELKLTYSTAPLDGSAALIKLDALSQPVLAATERFSEKVAASTDGAMLNVEVTLPEGDGPFPAIMSASPYNTPARASAGRANDAAVQYWTARGYAFVTMDLRGTGTSGGCYAARAAVDQQDIADAVEWVADQEWSSGKVGIYGFSYNGFTPAAAAVRQPNGLSAIYIGGAAVDMWSNYVPGGVDTGRTFSTVVLGYGIDHAAKTTPDSNPLGPVQYTADAFCDPTILLGNDPRHVYDAWWAERNVTALAADIHVPVFLEQGFWDNNVKSNYVPDLFNQLTVPKRAIFGSWEHIWALRADQQLRQLAWFDEHLKGIDTGIMETPVVEVLTNTRMIRAADAWPPLDATYVDIDLGSGSLVAVPPQAPIPPETFTATLDALAGPLYLTGVGLLDLEVTLPLGGNALFEARVHEHTADDEWIFAGVGWINAAHLEAHTVFEPFAPGETRTLQLKLLPQDHVFQAGSEIVVEIRAASDSWGGPESGLNAPTPVEIGAATLRLPTLPVDTLAPQPRSAS